MTRRPLTLTEAAEYVGHSTHALYAWRRDARTDRPQGFRAGRRVLYDLTELDAWLDTQRRQSAALLNHRLERRTLHVA